MAGWTYATLTTAIRDYTEVDSNVFTQGIIDGFIMNAEYRIAYDVPMDSDRVRSDSQFATDNNSVNVPAECLFVRGVEVFNSTTSNTVQEWEDHSNSEGITHINRNGKNFVAYVTNQYQFDQVAGLTTTNYYKRSLAAPSGTHNERNQK